jgi:tight adherence protein C
MFEPANLPPITRVLILLLVFLLVLIVVYSVASPALARLAVRRRIDERLMPSGSVASATLRSERTNSAWVRLVNAIEQHGLSLADTKDDKLRARLIAAGFTHPSAPRVFTLTRLVLTLGLPIFFGLLVYLSGQPMGLLKLYLFGAAFALLGLYGPNLFISAKADRRRDAIINGFPDALDLMLVCVEAGMGLEAAFSRVGGEIMRQHPLLAEMFGGAVLEMRAGRSREDALRRMADRAQIDEIRAFTTLLIQSSKLGSSIAQTLRIYAAEMREARRMRAEEKAHRLPVLISIPLVTCMLPVMIGVLMLPAAIRVIRLVLPVLAGHS